MTTNELHEILDNPDVKLSPGELSKIIYQLKSDVMGAYALTSTEDDFKRGYYLGEQNAFYLVLDLLEHIDLGK